MTARAYKCERAISLADCYVIAVAKLQQASALFARHETDLDREIERNHSTCPSCSWRILDAEHGTNSTCLRAADSCIR